MPTIPPTSRAFLALALVLGAAAGPSAPRLAADEAKPLFAEDFAKAAEVPDTLMVLNGEFSIASDGDNKALAVAPSPLDTFNFLFGPTTSAGTAVRARIKGASKGRQSPTFGIGSNGVSGYVLRIAGAKGALELVHDDAVLASAPFAWKSDTWTRFHLQVRKAEDGSWAVEGKAWADGAEEPKAWAVTAKEDKEPVAGRASCWAIPYSGKPILFDDLAVLPLAGAAVK